MTTSIIVSLLVYCAYSDSLGCGQTHSDSPTSSKTISHLGYTRTYIVHRPLLYDDNLNTPIPLIFGLPGYSITADYFSNYFGLKEYADTLAYSDTFLSVIVQGTRFPSNGNTLSWNDISCSSSPGPEGCSGDECNLSTCVGTSTYDVPFGCPNDDGCNWCNCLADDVQFIDFLAQEIENNYCIDTTREYALGYSNGAMMTHRIGCELNNRFAAIAPFAGQQHINFNCAPKIANNKIGIINVWGTKDNIIPGDGSTSSDGFFYSSVSDVQQAFAEYNGCSIISDASYPSSVDCNNCNWQCRTYNIGDDCQHTVQCSYNGNHNYPKNEINKQSSPNFALPVVWEYLQQFSRPTINTISKKKTTTPTTITTSPTTPSANPTADPTRSPTTDKPTTAHPTTSPSTTPTNPTADPTRSPTTDKPTIPTLSPTTTSPTVGTLAPTTDPTTIPSKSPTTTCRVVSEKCQRANQCCSAICAKNGPGPKRCQSAVADGIIANDGITSDPFKGEGEGEGGGAQTNSDSTDDIDSVENADAVLYDIMDNSETNDIHYTITISTQIWTIFGVFIMGFVVNVMGWLYCSRKIKTNHIEQDFVSTV